MTSLKKALAATAIVALGTAAISQIDFARAADKLKVAFVYVGPVTDGGWNAAHFEGQKAVEKEFGDKVETVKVENVPENADAERVETQLAQQGAGLVFATSFGFMDPTVSVAKAFPKVKFEHCCGFKVGSNMSVYNIRFYESRTVQGTLAGMLTKSNVIGYIASFPIPEVIMGIDSFALAMRKVNPKATIKVVWVNTWYDPGKEADAAKALMDQGADVIAQHTDSPAAVQAAEARHVYSFGEASDMSSFGPNTVVTSEVDVWSVFYTGEVKAVLDGSWKACDKPFDSCAWWGLKEGALVVPDVNAKLPKDVQEMGA